MTMNLQQKQFMKKSSRRSYSFVFVLMAIIGLTNQAILAQDDGIPRGAYTMPYTRYEASPAGMGGGAIFEQAPDYDQAKIAAEASGRQYVSLPSNGSFVEWTLTEEAQGFNMRFTMPDDATGNGLTGSLGLYVNGTKIKDINLTSYWAYQYFQGVEPEQHPGGKTRMRFDEIHFRLDNAIPVGATLRIAKDNGDGITYGVDFLELEPVPAALSAPNNALNVVDFGATPDDQTDDFAAFVQCITTADEQGKNVYIPAGRFYLSDKLPVEVSNMTIQGAGIWYTDLYFSTDKQFYGGIMARATNLDIGHFNVSTINNDRFKYDEQNARVPAEKYKIYKGFMGTYGADSKIHDVWVEHFECGMWIAGYDPPYPIDITTGLVISKVRLRNNYADGINFCQGTNNSVVEYSSIRNSGDDGLAMWPNNFQSAPQERNNTFRYNTIENIFRAGGIAIFGGTGHQVYRNIIKDGFAGSGIRFTNDFPGYTFERNADKIIITDNYIESCGTSYDLWDRKRGAIEFFTSTGIYDVEFNNTIIKNSQRHAIQIYGSMTDVVFNNTTIDGAGVDAYTDMPTMDDWGGYGILTQASGNVTFNKVSFNNIESYTEGDDPVWGNIKLHNTNFNIDVIVGHVDLTDFSIAPSSVSIAEGGSSNLNVNFVPTNASEKGLVWSSSNNAVATVVEGGTGLAVVNAVSVGSATITAVSVEGNITKTIAVDVTPAVSISASEGDVAEGGSNGTFTIGTSVLTNNVTVNYTVSGTASSSDYMATPALSGSVTLTPSNTSQTITIAAYDDSEFEGAESLMLTLQESNDFSLGTSTASLSIADNENPPCTAPNIGLTNTAPIIDQNVDAVWGEVGAISINNVTIGGMPADFSASYKAMFDNTNLYVLVETSDNSKNNDSGANWWNDDVINIFIDGDNSKGTSYDNINDFQLAFRYDDNSTVLLGQSSVQKTDGIDFNIYSTPSGYSLEVAIPWSTIGVSPEIGSQIGIDVVIEDDDNGGERDSQIAAHSTSESNWSNPSLFGTAYLTACGDVILPNAGPDQTLASGTTSTTLDGSASSGPAGYTYAWSQFSGPSATISNASAVKPNVTGLVDGAIYQFQLTTSLEGNSANDVVQLTVLNNVAPTVNAGADKSAKVSDGSVVFNASATDNDGSISSYAWTQISGANNATLSGLNTAKLTVTNYVVGNYEFRVTATDNQGATATDIVALTVSLTDVPTVSAGADQSVQLPANNVTLVGSASDTDGTIDSFAWTQVSGPTTASLSGETTATLSASNLLEGTYVFKLTVIDNDGAEASDEVVVTVSTEPVYPTDRGYYDAPYTRYEATASNTGGGASILPKSFKQKDIQFEASDRSCASLSSNGSYVEWNLEKAGQGLVMRFSIPDAPNGGGISGKLGLYVNGSKVQDIDLTSKWAWQYFSPNPGDGTKDPYNQPQNGWTARMAFDEVRVTLPNSVTAGSTIRIQKDNGDGIDYLVDFIEMEPIPAPLAKPANSLDVTDYGAIPNDGIDDKDAFNNCYSDAMNQGKGIYIPAGRFDFSTEFYIYTDGMSFTGAGMWHTEIYFTNGNPGNGGFNPNATELTFSDFYMNTENTTRALPYKGFVGRYGTGSVISNVWLEHFECGAWIANFHGNDVADGLEIVNCRFRNTYADGVNFSKGTSNSICHHSSFRNNGDDAMASWSSQDGPLCLNNEFAYNTAENTWRAAGVGFFGGGGHTAHHIVVKDPTEAGLRINSDFQGKSFNGDLIEFSDITVIGAGTNANLWFNRYGAIDIFTRLYNMDNVTFRNIDVLESQKDAIFIYTVNPSYTINNLRFENVTVNGTGVDENQNNYTDGTWDDYEGYGVLTDGQVKGSATFCNVDVQNSASQPGIYQENPDNFNIIYDANCDQQEEPTGISVNPASLALSPSQTASVSATVLPSTANGSVNWTTSNSAVATVSASGIVTAHADGSAVITGRTVNGLTDVCNVSVSTTIIDVTGVTLTPGSVTFSTIGSTQQLTAEVLPTNATNKNVSFSTSNASVATVSSTGLVTAVSNGTATITVTTEQGSYVANSEIMVEDIPEEQNPYSGTPVSLPGTVEAENYDLGGEGVAYSDSDASNNGGEYRTSEGVDIEPCTQGGYNVGWTSAGEWLEYTVNVQSAGLYNLEIRVASIFDAGTFHIEFNGADVTGTIASLNTGAWQTWESVRVQNVNLSAGEQIMRIALDNPNHNIDKVIVTSANTEVPVTGISISSSTADLSAGETLQLSAHVLPTNATNQGISWSTSNASVATVSNGIITANAAGEALITASSNEGNFSATCNVVVTDDNGTGLTYYRIRNVWQSDQYLTDGGDRVTYTNLPANAGLEYEWILEDVGDGRVEIKNAATGDYMHIENLQGFIQCGTRTSGWWSSRWVISDAGNGESRIANLWQSNDYIHVENTLGHAQHGSISDAWASAKWVLESRLKSAGKAYEQFSIAEVVVYPNPVQNILCIDIPEATVENIRLTDIAGRTIHNIRMDMENSHVKIDMSDLKSGMYIVTLIGFNGEITNSQIIKQ